MSTSPLQFARAVLALLFAVLLAACGGGGVVTVDPPASAVSVFSPRPLDPEYLARRAVNYSPYRSGNRDTEIVTSAMIKQDMELLVQANLRLIRLFDSSTILSKPNGGRSCASRHVSRQRLGQGRDDAPGLRLRGSRRARSAARRPDDQDEGCRPG